MLVNNLIPKAEQSITDRQIDALENLEMKVAAEESRLRDQKVDLRCALVVWQMKLVNEKYFAILLDRQTMGPLIIACPEGGTSIEDLAEKCAADT